MNKRFAIFLDIDNTLYTDGIVPKVNINTLKEVREEGSFVFINTARSYGFIPEKILKEVPLDGVVAGIGTDLRINEKQIFSAVMQKDELKKIADYFMGDTREVGFEGEDTVLWMNPEKDRTAIAYLHSPDEFDTIYKETKISKMYIKGQLSEYENQLFGQTNIMYQHETYAEFVPKGFGKAVGMINMIKHLDIPLERCIAMGDSANDEDMLRAAGISVAMGNAIPEIKAICTYTSCNSKDGGVAQALRHFVLKN